MKVCIGIPFLIHYRKDSPYFPVFLQSNLQGQKSFYSCLSFPTMFN